MAVAVPQAPPPKTPSTASKLPPLPLATKAGSTDPAASMSLKSKFQALLDQAGQPKKLSAEAGEKAALEKAKITKSKAEVLADAVKSPAKKVDPKDSKTDGTETNLGALVHQPRADQTKALPKETVSEGTSAADRSRTKPERRAVGEPGSMVAWNPGALETIRTQNAGSASAANGASRSDDKPKVVVVDRRTEAKEREKLKLPGSEAAAMPVTAAAELAPPPKVADPRTMGEFQVSLQTASGRSPAGFDLKPQSTAPSPRDAASFQQYLIDRGYGQLVDQARIVLKDQNAGEIRMTLYPETLGKVKVALNLTDNSLAGQIFVENQTVKDVFQSNMDGLLQAFRDGGWDNLSLQVSVGQGGGGGTSSDGRTPFQGPTRDYERQLDHTVVQEPRADRIGSWNDRTINLTA